VASIGFLEAREAGAAKTSVRRFLGDIP
jgi:hypothetical protein